MGWRRSPDLPIWQSPALGKRARMFAGSRSWSPNPERDSWIFPRWYRRLSLPSGSAGPSAGYAAWLERSAPGRILGNRMTLTKEDVDAILKATKPVPLSPQVRLQTTSYEDLVKLRTKQAPKAGTRRRVRCPRKPKSEGWPAKPPGRLSHPILGRGLAIGSGLLNDPFFPGGLSMGNPKIAVVSYFLAVGFILVVAFYSSSKPLITASVPVVTSVAGMKWDETDHTIRRLIETRAEGEGEMSDPRPTDQGLARADIRLRTILSSWYQSSRYRPAGVTHRRSHAVRNASQTDLNREFKKPRHTEWPWSLIALLVFIVIDCLYSQRWGWRASNSSLRASRRGDPKGITRCTGSAGERSIAGHIPLPRKRPIPRTSPDRQ